MIFFLGMVVGLCLSMGAGVAAFALCVREKSMAAKREAAMAAQSAAAKRFHFRRTGRILPKRTTLTDRYRAFLLE